MRVRRKMATGEEELRRVRLMYQSMLKQHARKTCKVTALQGKAIKRNSKSLTINF